MHRLLQPKRAATRTVAVFAFVFMLAVTANAYTVVMRGGRRIEIPLRFVVTATTLTYEAAPGIQITLQMAAIDISATEKANNEKSGSLLRRLKPTTLESSSPTERQVTDGQLPVLHASRTITNRELEPTVRRRRDSELAYERKRKELGLPSVEESRRQAALESASIGMELEQQRLAESDAEHYWRERATALRSEMAALDAELAYVRARIDEGPLAISNRWSSDFNTITRGVPFSNFGRWAFGNPGARGAFPPSRERSPSIFVAPNAGSPITGRVAFGGGGTRGQAFLNPGTLHPARTIGGGGRFRVFPNSLFASTVANYDVSYERSVLITRFNELAAARAGLGARWRELEEEARRAGAPPGWLRQ